MSEKIKDGPFETFYDNGSIESRGFYKNNQLHGLYHRYDGKERLLEISHYDEGKLSGWRHLFNTYNTDSLEISCSDYYRNGKSVRTLDFKDGLPVKVHKSDSEKDSHLSISFDEDNNFLTQYSSYNHNNNNSKFFLENRGPFYDRIGIPSTNFDLRYFNFRDIDHIDKNYNTNGQLEYERVVFGSHIKSHTKYFENGVLNIDFNIKDGKYNGISNFFHKSGILRGKIHFKDNIQQELVIYNIKSLISLTSHLNIYEEGHRFNTIFDPKEFNKLLSSYDHNNFVDRNIELVEKYSDFLKNLDENIQQTDTTEWYKFDELDDISHEFKSEEDYSKNPIMKKRVIKYYGLKYGESQDFELIYEKMNKCKIKIITSDGSEHEGETKWGKDHRYSLVHTNFKKISGNLDKERFIGCLRLILNYESLVRQDCWVRENPYRSFTNRPWEKYIK